MRRFSLLAATAMAVAALGTTGAAQGRGSGKAPTKATNVGTSAPKGGGQAAHGASSAKAGSTASGSTAKTTHSAPGAAKKSTTTTASTSTGTTSGSSTASGSSTTTTTASTGTTPTFEANAISTKISQNPNQLARVKGMLPPNMSIEEASAGFRNQGQFIAALNASKNQQIDFVQLKEAMTVDGLSLGQAAKQVRNAPPEAPAPAPAPTTGGTTGTGTTGTGTTGTGTSTTTAAK